MSNSYEGWWRVSIPQISKNQTTEDKNKDLENKKPTLRNF